MIVDSLESAVAIAALVRMTNAATAWPMGTLDGRVLIETPVGQLSWQYPHEYRSWYDALPSHAKPWDGADESTVRARLMELIAKMDEYSKIAHDKAREETQKAPEA